MSKFEGYKKGVDLGGWLSQCKEYTKEHFDSFITPSDFDVIASWGLDHVRLPVDYNILDGKYDDCNYMGYDYIDMAVSECKRTGLNIIIDLHKTAGFSFDPAHGEGGFFENEELHERFYQLWEDIANRYGKYSDMASFELLNEVTDEKYAKCWNEMARKCIERIRPIAPDIHILVGGVWNNSVDAVPMLDAPYDDKIVYNFHCYEPLIFTHQGAYWIEGMPADLSVSYPASNAEYKKIAAERVPQILKYFHEVDGDVYSQKFFENLFAPAVEYAKKHNVPLYCGEYGVIDSATPEDTLAWYKDINAVFEKFGISRAAWSYRKMDFGLTDERLSGVIDELKKYF